ncbi:hypothetical protein Tco_1168402, partial [Tanacetum coccineum]
MVTRVHSEPAASESLELNPEDLTARLEDIKVEIDTLHADREDSLCSLPNCTGSHFLEGLNF